MRKKLLTVEDTFWIPTRGLAVTESGTADGIKGLKIGTPVMVVFPDGRSVESEVLETEEFKFISGGLGQGILLKGFLKKENLKGAEVFIDEKKSREN